MSQDAAVKQCCTSDPIWIFIYSDGSIFTVCANDFLNPIFRSNVKEVINMVTQESFSPEKIFGE